jgi:hypothetical protein
MPDASNSRTAAGDWVTINVSLWDNGCIPQLFSKEDVNVERRIRGIGDQLSEQDRVQHTAYLGQLQACLASIDSARHGH